MSPNYLIVLVTAPAAAVLHRAGRADLALVLGVLAAVNALLWAAEVFAGPDPAALLPAAPATSPARAPGGPSWVDVDAMDDGAGDRPGCLQAAVAAAAMWLVRPRRPRAPQRRTGRRSLPPHPLGDRGHDLSSDGQHR
jgi:hypothetical protein